MTNKFDSLTLALPAHWLPAAPSAVTQRLTPGEARAAEYGVLACDCYDVTVWFHAETEAA